MLSRKHLLALFLIAIASSTTILNSCSENEIVTQTIWGLVRTDPELSTLAELVEKFELKSNINDPNEERTLFAPTNAAFDSLESLLSINSIITDVDSTQMRYILLYHILPANVTSENLLSDAPHNTLVSESVPEDVINVNADGTLLTGSTNTSILIEELDIPAFIGFLHKTSDVLIPQSIGPDRIISPDSTETL